MASQLAPGDFTGLANNYAQNRPGYSELILPALSGLLALEPGSLRAADVGAGTGIWTKMLYDYGIRDISAVEPNDDMRAQGQIYTSNTSICWTSGTGESTGLDSSSFDIISMASSFHWVDFDKGVKEFHRILKEKGIFVSLWNPRIVSKCPLLQRIEDHISYLKPDIVRQSSGLSGITQGLSERLANCGLFSNVIYLESPHTVQMSIQRYLGAWQSVNDLRVQLGEELFSSFLTYVIDQTRDLDFITAYYQTRCWVAIK